MGAIRNSHSEVYYSNRRKVASQSGVGRTLKFTGVVMSCLAGVIVPAFFFTSVFLPAILQAKAPSSAPVSSLKQPAHNVAEVLNAYTKLAALRGFRAKVTTTYLSRPPQESRFEFSAPDRFHSLSETAEMVLVSRMMFLKYAGRWVPVTVNVNLCFIDPTSLRNNYASALNREYLGDEVVDGVIMPMFQYQLECSNSRDTVRLWTSPIDGLPQKLEGTAPNGTTTTVIYYDFNANIAISTPTP